MRFKRMWALFVARNYEFIRDKSGFGWNILFPFLIVAGFGLLFNSGSRQEFKMGVFPVKNLSMESLEIPEKLKAYSFIQIVPFESYDKAVDKLVHHKIDILMKNGMPVEYWVSDSSPKGELMEKVVKEAIIPEARFAGRIKKQEIKGEQVRR